jgi:hypothetical protein
MSRMLRGPSRGEEALYENVEEFVRAYTQSMEPLPKGHYFTLPGYRSPETDPPRPRLPAYDVDNEVEFEPDPHPKGNPPTTASVITDPLPTGITPSSVALATDNKPRADLPSTEATPMADPPVSPDSIPGSPQSPIFEPPDLTSPLKKSSPYREVGDRLPSEGPDSPRLE